MYNGLETCFAQVEPFEGHALLSPSGAHRWLNCPGCIHFIQEVEKKDPSIKDSSSKASDEGTRAHAVAEVKLIKNFNAGNQTKYPYDTTVVPDDEYMDQVTDGYATYVFEEITKIQNMHKDKSTSEFVKDHEWYSDEYFGTEVPIRMDWIPTYGRTDAVYILLTTKTVHVAVFDFKYGYSRVEVRDNPQLKLYALGAIATIEKFIGSKDVYIDTYIYQPRVDNVGKASYTYEELVKWNDKVKVMAVSALNGTGKIKPGSHCVYCPASKYCKERLSYDFKCIADKLKEASELVKKEETGETLASMLTTLDGLKATAEKLESTIKEKALDYYDDKGDVPGYVVKTKKGREMYDNKAQIVTNLVEGGYTSDISILEPVSPGKLKKAIGVEAYDQVTYGCLKQAKPSRIIEKDKTILENADLFD